jgi:ribosomal protein L37E
MTVLVVIALVLLVAAAGVAGWVGSKPKTLREWRRTCRRCGRTWFVSQEAAREQAPDRAQMVAAKMYRAGKRGTLFTTRAAAAELEVHNLEAKAERVRAAGSCPGCGSQSYDQTLVAV